MLAPRLLDELAVAYAAAAGDPDDRAAHNRYLMVLRKATAAWNRRAQTETAAAARPDTDPAFGQNAVFPEGMVGPRKDAWS